MEGAVRYEIDTQKSLFTVHPFATGLGSVLSHGLTIAVRDFTGSVSLDPDTLKQASLMIRIKADSLTVNDQIKQDDRREIERVMKQEVLRTSEHPEVVFESSYIALTKVAGLIHRADITGKLSLNGVRRELLFTSQVIVRDESLRANGEFKIKQTNFGIPLITAGGGLIKLHDDLKFHFYIVADKQEN